VEQKSHRPSEGLPFPKTRNRTELTKPEGKKKRTTTITYKKVKKAHQILEIQAFLILPGRVLSGGISLLCTWFAFPEEILDWRVIARRSPGRPD
jgi:hypothetical protein